MIRCGFDPICIQARRHIFRAVAALAVNDAAIDWTPLDETQKLFVGTVFRQHAIGEIRPIETRDVTTRLTQTKLLHDVGANSFRRSCSERHDRDIRKEFAKLGKLPIFRPKVVAPFADAMRLVDRDQIDLPLSQVSKKARQHCPLRSHIQQAKRAIAQAQHPRGSFIRLER